MRLIVIALMALALTGCAEMIERMQEARDNRDDARCQNYGFDAGTPEYAQCRMQLDAQRQQASERQREIMQQNAAMQQQNLLDTEQMLLNARPVAQPTIVCHTFGNTTTCN